VDLVQLRAQAEQMVLGANAGMGAGAFASGVQSKKRPFTDAFSGDQPPPTRMFPRAYDNQREDFEYSRGGGYGGAIN
jgi:hypothetical protein